MTVTNHCQPHTPIYPQTYVATPPGIACKCPVCDGKGSVPHDFYPATEPGLLKRPDGRMTCKSCYGAGYLWQYQSLPQPVWQPPYTSDSATWTPPPGTTITYVT